MALSFHLTNSQGVDVGYWHIAKIEIGYKAKYLMIQVLGYLDQTAREDGMAHLEEKFVRVEVDQFDSLVVDNQVSKAACYTFIKALPEWSGAEDI